MATPDPGETPERQQKSYELSIRRRTKFLLSATVKSALAQDRPESRPSSPQTSFGASVQVWTDVLSIPSLGALDGLVGDIVGNLGTTDTDGSFYYPSFWCPADDSRRDWERFFSVFAGVIKAGPVAGVEWWLRHDEAAEPKVFHFDKDEALMRSERRLVNPAHATVFYLSSQGGPTLIAAQTATAEGELRPKIPLELAAVPCRTNQLLAFPGGLRHAVLGGEATGLRTTFLMNWWPARPTGMALTPREITFPGIELGSPGTVEAKTFDQDLFTEVVTRQRVTLRQV